MGECDRASGHGDRQRQGSDVGLGARCVRQARDLVRRQAEKSGRRRTRARQGAREGPGEPRDPPVDRADSQGTGPGARSGEEPTETGRARARSGDQAASFSRSEDARRRAGQGRRAHRRGAAAASRRGRGERVGARRAHAPAAGGGRLRRSAEASAPAGRAVDRWSRAIGTAARRRGDCLPEARGRYPRGRALRDDLRKCSDRRTRRLRSAGALREEQAGARPRAPTRASHRRGIEPRRADEATPRTRQTAVRDVQ